MACQIKSDYLDTSSPHRVKAFFLFCDCANKAEQAKHAIEISDPRMRRIVIAVIEGERRMAIDRAFELFDPFIPSRSSF